MRHTHRLGALALALVLLAALSACNVKPAAVPLEDRITYADDSSAPPSESRPQASSSQSATSTISRPSNPTYELLTFDGSNVTGADGRKMVFETLPGSTAANVVCNAFSAEVTGEFWRWQFLCQTPIRQPALAIHWLDALEQGYLEGYGYQTITVHNVYEMTAEQLYNTMDGRGENPILWPYFLRAENAASYEMNVDDFLSKGDRVVYLDCSLEYTPSQAAQNAVNGERLSAWYYLKTGDDGRLWIVNDTYYTDGKFVV